MILTTAITWGWELLPLGVLAGCSVAACIGWYRCFNRLLKAQYIASERQIAGTVWQIRAQAAESSLAEQDALYRAHMKAIGLKGNKSPKRRRQA